MITGGKAGAGLVAEMPPPAVPAAGARRIRELRQRNLRHRGQGLFQKSFNATIGRANNGKSSRRSKLELRRLAETRCGS